MAESCDIFLPGAKELTQMYPDQSTENVVDKLMNKGVKKVVIKNGDKGCRIYSTQGIQEIPAFEVRCVDSIGAGDGFVAGFLVGQLRGLNDYKSGEIANAVGGLAVTVLGDIEGYPTQEELDNFIRKHPVVDR
jgi:2-dehydro-3-deoxygluconokinase